MNSPSAAHVRLLAGAAAIAMLGLGAGFGLAQLGKPRPAAGAAATRAPTARKVLYWYDPMIPGEHSATPGKSSMGMEMIPKYAEGGGSGADGGGVRMSPAAEQNLGVRLTTVRRGVLGSTVDAVGVLDFNQRDVAIVQARQAGFVQRVYGRAPGDVIRAGAPIADLLIPAWGGAQTEFLAVKRTGDPALIAAARQRLRLLGMPDPLIAAVERSGSPRNVVTISTPVGGAIQTLAVRQGMSVAAGETLAQVAGLSTVWLDAAVPEAQGGLVGVGEAARVEIAGFTGETFTGRVTAILPTAQADSRTLTARVELPNPQGRLRPGMFAAAHFSGHDRPTLLVASEAVIRTGERDLVMLAEAGGRYQPVQVEIGRQAGDETEILAGLAEGQRVVASGQFLLDSEASLAGVAVTPIGNARPMPEGPR